MDISVIVPTRNRSALLAMTLRSVLRQRDVDYEVIVVDEASTDDTPAMLAALGNARIRVIRHDIAQGIAAARNRGAAEAGGEWLAFIDDDDLWAPEKLVCQLHAAEQAGRDWAYTGAVVINLHDRILRVQRPLPPGEMVEALLKYHAIPGGGSNVLVRRAAWQRVGPFDTRLKNTEDWEMCIRLAKQGPPAYVSGPLIARRLHQSNATLDISEIVRGARLIEKLHHTKVDWGALHRWFAHSCMRARRLSTALGHFGRAAVRGQGRAVASDLSVILQGIVSGRTPKSSDYGPDQAWIAIATEWLQELSQSVHGRTEDPRVLSDRSPAPEAT